MRRTPDPVPLCSLCTDFFRNTPYPSCPVENAHCSRGASPGSADGGGRPQRGEQNASALVAVTLTIEHWDGASQFSLVSIVQHTFCIATMRLAVGAGDMRIMSPPITSPVAPS